MDSNTSGPVKRNRDLHGEAAFCIAIWLLAVLIFYVTANLPIPRWEPVGPAFVPRALSLFLSFFAFVVLVQALLQARKGTDTLVSAPAYPLRPGRMIVAMSVVVVAAIGMSVEAIDFRIVGFFLVLGSGFAISGFRVRVLPMLAAVAGFLSVGIHTLFTKIFYISLG